MSFYNHPYFQQQHQRRAHPAFSAGPAPAFNFFTSPPPPPPPHHPFSHPSYGHPSHPTYPTHPSYDEPEPDYEAEERAAIAQVRAIQHRRRLAEAEHDNSQQRREAEIRALIEREIQQAREREIAKAREQEVLRVREQRERTLLIEHHRQRVLAQAHAQAQRERVLAHAEAERVRDMARRQRQMEMIQAQKEKHHRQCAEPRQRCTGGIEREEENSGVEDLHRFMKMLGINLGQEVHDEENKQVKVEEKKVETPAPTPATEAAKPTDPAHSLPDNLNALLGHFLGLNVQPISEGTTASQETGEAKEPDVAEKKAEEKKVEVAPAPAPTAAPNAGPSSTKPTPNTHDGYDLNNFLSRFGCQIDRSTFNQFLDGRTHDNHTSTPSSSAHTTKATPAVPADTEKSNETPLTSYLNQVVDIPPFVRDILSNVELAFKESNRDASSDTAAETYSGKGKGVAPGEKAISTTPTSTKRTSSTPTKSDTTPLTKLNEIAHDLYLATESFTFPPTLSFSKATPIDTNTQTPQLLFNKTNSSYHAQAHKFLQLLLSADGIVSGGDAEVRRKRKEVVKSVEGAIEELERKRDDIWRMRVESGREEEEEVRSERSSRSASVVAEGDGEGAEGFEVTDKVEVEDSAPVSTAEDVNADDTSAEEQKVDDEANKDDHSTVVDDKQTPTEGDKKSVTVEDVTEKEEGYELL